MNLDKVLGDIGRLLLLLDVKMLCDYVEIGPYFSETHVKIYRGKILLIVIYSKIL